MNKLLIVLICLIALEHLYFLWLEMFGWETTGKKVFKGALREDLFTPTKTLAANQGLYNGFLAAGLIWTLFIDDVVWFPRVSLFFLTCVLIAGIYGGMTASKKIYFVQALPAILAILCLYIGFFI